MPRLLRLDNLQQFAAINVTSDPGAIGGKKKITQAAEVIVSWADSTGKPHHNILIGRYSGAFSLTVANANTVLAGLTQGANWTALATFLASTAGLTRVSFRDLNTVDQPLIDSTALGANGTSASPELPAEVAAVVTLRTPFAGIQNRGRMFVPGWATNALGAGNVMAPAAVTALQNWAGTISGVLSGIGLTWSIGHLARQAYTGSTGTQHPARSDGTVPIQTVIVRDNHWDTVRRRGLR